MKKLSDGQFEQVFGISPAEIKRLEGVKKKVVARMNKAIEAAWYEQASGVQVDVMDIPKIFARARTMMAAGASATESVTTLIADFRKN